MAGLTYTQPLLAVFLLIGFAGVIRMWRRPGAPKPVVPAIALAGLFLVTWPPFEWLFSRPLELPYQKLLSSDQVAQAIVVPASSIDPPRKNVPIALADSSTYARCRYAAWLYHNWRRVPVVVSGGGNSGRNQPPFAAGMQHILLSEGVPPEAIFQEGRSMSTWENAVFTAEMLAGMKIREIALVVEADSMLRADLCFRRQGLTVVPAPFRHRGISSSYQELIPCWTALRGNELTLHEMLGLAWYKLRGRI